MQGHDYNMFKSQAGGACDCGDASVMRESGFCTRVSHTDSPLSSSSSALCNSYNLEMGKMSRNHFEATELIPMPCAKPNHEQKPNWRY